MQYLDWILPILVLAVIVLPRIPWTKLMPKKLSLGLGTGVDNHRSTVFQHWDGLYQEAGDDEREALLQLLPRILEHCEKNHASQPAKD